MKPEDITVDLLVTNHVQIIDNTHPVEIVFEQSSTSTSDNDTEEDVRPTKNNIFFKISEGIEDGFYKLFYELLNKLNHER